MFGTFHEPCINQCSMSSQSSHHTEYMAFQGHSSHHSRIWVDIFSTMKLGQSGQFTFYFYFINVPFRTRSSTWVSWHIPSSRLTNHNLFTLSGLEVFLSQIPEQKRQCKICLEYRKPQRHNSKTYPWQSASSAVSSSSLLKYVKAKINEMWEKLIN